MRQIVSYYIIHIVWISWTACPHGSMDHTQDRDSWGISLDRESMKWFMHLSSCEPRITILFSSPPRIFPQFGTSFLLNSESTQILNMSSSLLFDNGLMTLILTLLNKVIFSNLKAFYLHPSKRICFP